MQFCHGAQALLHVHKNLKGDRLCSDIQLTLTLEKLMRNGDGSKESVMVGGSLGWREKGCAEPRSICHLGKEILRFVFLFPCLVTDYLKGFKDKEKTKTYAGIYNEG